MQALMTETNTNPMRLRVLRAARFRLGRGKYQADFEHGQWWVTNTTSGAQWSVVDCATQDGVAYLDFDQVTAEGE